MPARPIILASASPRRHDLLRAAGFDFTIEAPEVDEIHDHRLAPEELTVLNALRKAVEISTRFPEALVLGADTLVYLDGEPLGKPADLNQAAGMLARLSGREHAVCTGLGVAIAGKPAASTAVITRVRFGTLEQTAIRRYHALVNPLDKAGAYGIQEHADLLQADVDGPLDNVIGLPVDAAADLLARFRNAGPPDDR